MELTPEPRRSERAAPADDRLSILSGTSQNLVGIVIAGLATFGVNVLISRSLGPEGLGLVTVAAQAAFVLSFATRAGMDMAVLRDVAIEGGAGRWGAVRAPVARAAQVGFGVSVVASVLAAVFAGPLGDLLPGGGEDGRKVVQAAAVALPFLALTNVWLSATRGLKIMRYTLYVFWAGQPLLWIGLMVAGWTLSRTAWMSVAAYSASWAVAAAAALWFWRAESKQWPVERMEPGRIARLLRYAGPRAPAALFSQLLFWTDLFVLTRYSPAGEVGVYSAVLRTGQVIVLFLTSVNLMFAPYVADLHSRGETDALGALFKSLTRWTLTATLPIALLLLVTPESVLRVFGTEFSGGEAALRIIVAGQLINVATGSVGFILIMIGRTGWDLLVYAGSLALQLAVAFVLAPRLGIEGAAIANAVTFALSNVVRLLLVVRFVRIQPYDGNYLRLVPAALAALLAMVASHALVGTQRFLGLGWTADLTATAVVGALVYGGCVLWFGAAPSERQGLARLIAARGRR